MTIANLNAPRPLNFFNCAENDPRLAGGRFLIDGVEVRMGVQLARVLLSFRNDLWDENNDSVPTMSVASPTDNDIARLATRGLKFKRWDKRPEHWVLLTPYRHLGWYSQM